MSKQTKLTNRQKHLIWREQLVEQDQDLIVRNREIVEELSELKAERVNNLQERRDISKQIRRIDHDLHNSRHHKY